MITCSSNLEKTLSSDFLTETNFITVVIKAKVVGACGYWGNIGVVAVLSKVCSGLEVHWRWAGHVIGAFTSGSRRSNAGLELVDIGVCSIGVVCEAKGMVEVGNIALGKRSDR